MADADVIAFIFDDARQRGVPCILSANGRAAAYAMPPDFEIVRIKPPLPPTEDMFRDLLGWPPAPDPAGPLEPTPPDES